MTRKTKRDWFTAGVQLLAQKGPQALTIGALCQQLGVTKGSFYHHFRNRDDFKQHLLTFYENEGTLNIIDHLAARPTPADKLRGLLDIIVNSSTAVLPYPEITIRAWALQDTAVRAVQQRVDTRRLDYVQSLCEDIVTDTASAQRMAQMLYAIFVGSEQMHPPITGSTLRALFDEFLTHYDLKETK